MEIRPIGQVHNSAEERTDFSDLISEIEIFPEFEQGLYRIEENEEVIVLFLFDRSDMIRMTVHPCGDPANPLVGVFASRTPHRPNHIGVTKVKLLERNGNVLIVKGLDALNRSPVIDIKPSGTHQHNANHK
jgi:formylmethanofuran dehydrogenase subunit E